MKYFLYVLQPHIIVCGYSESQCWKNLKSYRLCMILNIFSSGTSASDFTISDHKLLVLPLSFMLLHNTSWYYTLICGDSSIRNVLEIHKLRKGLSLLSTTVFYPLSSVGTELTSEKVQNDLGHLCFSMFFSCPSCYSYHIHLQVIGISYNWDGV